MIQTTATGLVSLLAFAWFVHLAGGLWRANIINRLAGTPESVAEMMGGTVCYTWRGVKVAATGARVVWRGGLRGPVTICHKRNGSKTRRSGLAQCDQIRQMLS